MKINWVDGYEITVRYDAEADEVTVSANRTEATDGDSVALSVLSKEAKIRHPARRVAKLIEKDFLINVRLDPSGKSVQLNTLARQARDAATLDIICPRCGGTTRAVPGQSARCAYCDSALPVPKE